jgi:hypothetical protein
MNLNDVHLIELVNWLNPIVFILGLGIAVWAFSRCRKRGYLVIAFYFALCIFNLLAMPSISRAIQAHRTPDISEQTQKKFDEAIQQAIHQVVEQDGHPYVPVVTLPAIRLPLISIVLVVGLWFIAKRESKANVSPDSK